MPHPALIAAEADPEVLGAAFYLMEPIDGFNATLGLPAPFDTDLAWQREMGLSMADAIAALAAVNQVVVGLADLGRFDGWAERQDARACAGLAPKTTGDQLHAHTVSLLEQALTLIS